MKDERQFIEYEKPDWNSADMKQKTPFTCHRMDLPTRAERERRTERLELAAVVAATCVGMMAICVLAALVWHL